MFHTKTGCKASLRVKLNEEGLYDVFHHVNLHNHPLSRKESTHLHHLERDMFSLGMRKTNEDMISSGMGAMESYEYMTYDVRNIDLHKLIIIKLYIYILLVIAERYQLYLCSKVQFFGVP